MHNSLSGQFAVEFVNLSRLSKKGLESLLREFRLNLKRLIERPRARELPEEGPGEFDRLPGVGAIGIGDRWNGDRYGLGRYGRDGRDDISRGRSKWRDVHRRDRCADLLVDLLVDLFLGVLQMIRPGLRLGALLFAGLLPRLDLPPLPLCLPLARAGLPDCFIPTCIQHWDRYRFQV